MNRYRSHIAHLLLAGFLFPQAANAVHYLVISHSLSHTAGENYELAIPPYDYHNCDYHFSSLKYYINTQEVFKLSVPPTGEAEEKYFYSIKFVNELAFHYSLRGPPQE